MAAAKKRMYTEDEVKEIVRSVLEEQQVVRMGDVPGPRRLASATFSHLQIYDERGDPGNFYMDRSHDGGGPPYATRGLGLSRIGWRLGRAPDGRLDGPNGADGEVLQIGGRSSSDATWDRAGAYMNFNTACHEVHRCPPRLRLRITEHGDLILFRAQCGVEQDSVFARFRVDGNGKLTIMNQTGAVQFGPGASLEHGGGTQPPPPPTPTLECVHHAFSGGTDGDYAARTTRLLKGGPSSQSPPSGYRRIAKVTYAPPWRG